MLGNNDAYAILVTMVLILSLIIYFCCHTSRVTKPLSALYCTLKNGATVIFIVYTRSNKVQLKNLQQCTWCVCVFVSKNSTTCEHQLNRIPNELFLLVLFQSRVFIKAFNACLLNNFCSRYSSSLRFI